MVWSNDLEKEREVRIKTLIKGLRPTILCENELLHSDEIFKELMTEYGAAYNSKYKLIILFRDYLDDDVRVLATLHLISEMHEKNKIHLDEEERQNLIWLFSAQYRRMKEPPAIDVEFPYSPN